MSDLHEDLEGFGHLFDVDPDSLQEDIGLRVKFINPKNPSQEDTFTIVAVQKTWKGELAYRVVGDADFHKIGRVALPSEVTPA